MTCDHLRDEYELHALGLAGFAERMELEAHLRDGCPTCAAGVRKARLTNVVMMTEFAPSVEVPRRLRKRVLASVGAEPKSWSWAYAWAAGFAALLVATLWLGNQGRQQNAELADTRQALSILNEPETKQIVFGEGAPLPPKGRVFVNSKQGVLLIASNLPEAPAGKTYELWVIPKGGTPKPSGLFQSGANGAAMYLSKRPFDVSQTAAVAVTLEPEAGSAAPTTKPVIVAPLAG